VLGLGWCQVCQQSSLRPVRALPASPTSLGWRSTRRQLSRTPTPTTPNNRSSHSWGSNKSLVLHWPTPPVPACAANKAMQEAGITAELPPRQMSSLRHHQSSAARILIPFEQKEPDYLLWGPLRSSFASSSTPSGCLLQLKHGLDEGPRGAKSG
jgi:hypothetical protein